MLYHNLRTQSVGLSPVFFPFFGCWSSHRSAIQLKKNSKWQKIKLLNMAILSLQFIKGDSLFSIFKAAPWDEINFRF